MRALAFTLLFVRTASAITITLLLLGLLFQAYARGGPPELGSVFQVIQGVLLSTLAYLFTTQAVDRAEAAVVAESRARGGLEVQMMSEWQRTAGVERDLALAGMVLSRLGQDEAIRRRIEALEHELGGDDADHRDPS